MILKTKLGRENDFHPLINDSSGVTYLQNNTISISSGLKYESFCQTKFASNLIKFQLTFCYISLPYDTQELCRVCKPLYLNILIYMKVEKLILNQRRGSTDWEHELRYPKSHHSHLFFSFDLIKTAFTTEFRACQRTHASHIYIYLYPNLFIHYYYYLNICF